MKVLKPHRKISEEDFISICEFLSKEGYLDDDWWCEEPTAWQRYCGWIKQRSR